MQDTSKKGNSTGDVRPLMGGCSSFIKQLYAEHSPKKMLHNFSSFKLENNITNS